MAYASSVRPLRSCEHVIRRALVAAPVGLAAQVQAAHDLGREAHGRHDADHVDQPLAEHAVGGRAAEGRRRRGGEEKKRRKKRRMKTKTKPGCSRRCR